MKDRWMIEVVLDDLRGAVIERLAFSSKRRMDLAYKKLVAAKRDHEERRNDAPKVIEVADDAQGKIAICPCDIAIVRSLNMETFEHLIKPEGDGA